MASPTVLIHGVRYALWISMIAFIVFITFNIRNPHPLQLIQGVMEPAYKFILYLVVFCIAKYDVVIAVFAGIILFITESDLLMLTNVAKKDKNIQ